MLVPPLGSNERMSVRKTDALPLGYGSVMVRAEGIEPPRASPSQSECGASTSFATLALRIEMLVLTGGLESPRFGLQNRCSPSELRQPENLQTAGRPRPMEIVSLPETTVCRPTKGDQYRISGPSYVLAGTAILNSKSLQVITRPHDADRCQPGELR